MDPYKPLFKRSLDLAKISAGSTVAAANFLALKMHGERIWELIDHGLRFIAPAYRGDDVTRFIVFVSADALLAFVVGGLLFKAITHLSFVRRYYLERYNVEGHWVTDTVMRAGEVAASPQFVSVWIYPNGPDFAIEHRVVAPDEEDIIGYCTNASFHWPKIEADTWEAPGLLSRKWPLLSATPNISCQIVFEANEDEKDGLPEKAAMAFSTAGKEYSCQLKRVKSREVEALVTAYVASRKAPAKSTPA